MFEVFAFKILDGITSNFAKYRNMYEYQFQLYLGTGIYKSGLVTLAEM